MASAEQVAEALALLVKAEKAYPRMVSTGRRDAECWWPVLEPTGDGEGESRAADNSRPPLPKEAKPMARAMGRKERTSRLRA